MPTQADVDQAFADLNAQVTKNTDVENSAALLLKSLFDQLTAALALGNPTAVAANTPAAPTP